MPFNPSAFHRLLKPLDRRVMAGAVAAHAGDHGVGAGDNAWTCARHLKALLFAQLAGRVAQLAGLQSLRAIVEGLAGQSAALYHLNRRAPCRSPLYLLTNDLERPAAEIARLYKERWDPGFRRGGLLLFKWLKQNLKIRRFLGRSENAVRIQIYVALIAFMLLRILASDRRPQRQSQHRPLAHANQNRPVPPARPAPNPQAPAPAAELAPAASSIPHGFPMTPRDKIPDS